MKLGAMIYSFGPAIRSGAMTQRDAIVLCAELGLACVDTMSWLGSDPWPDVRKMAEDAGLYVACHIASANLASTDKAERRKGMDAVRMCIEETVTLGADKLMIVTGNIPDGSDRPSTQQRIGEALGALADEAKGANVRLCIEDFPGEQSPHRTSEELLAVCDIAGPDLGICFDTGNFYAGGQTPEDAWPHVVDKTIHSHLKDWAWADDGRHITSDGRRFNPELVGQGIIDYPTVLAGMKASGYDGVLSFEYEGPRDRAEAAREGIAYLRSVLKGI
ncbi:MAG: sugar phosphate isomerase/epimerase [Planctomycetes bacterium]|nr:sugar phosphate isomerase/epimerase [Planctomycetota bacterium]